MEDEIILHPAAQKLVDDPTFLKIIEAKIQSITCDGKIDKKDIPDIVVLVVYCTNNLKKFNLNADTLGEVLEDTIMYLLCHFKVLPEDKSSEFRIMTKSIIDLVMMQPKFKSCFNSIINFILCRNK
uniref:Uncharacterized protein n=1 Tax=viral metagenome TaxID=1070528 RepID=A0A6C0HXQ3_9ZZZZ